MKSPRNVRISRFLGELTRRAQLLVDQLLGSVDGLCNRLGFPHKFAVRATAALTRLSQVLSCTVISYDLSNMTDSYLNSLHRDLQTERGRIITLNFLLNDFVTLVAKWEEPTVLALLLTLVFNIYLQEGIETSDSITMILNSILLSQGREESLGDFINWYCETLSMGSEEFLVYIVLEGALAQEIEESLSSLSSSPFS